MAVDGADARAADAPASDTPAPDAGPDALAPDAAADAPAPDAAADAGARDALACSVSRLDGPQRCPDGWVLWDDLLGGPPGDGSSPPPQVVGDNRCYERCASASECAAPARPYCTILGFYAGGDYSCSRAVRVCRCVGTDDCRMEGP